MSIRTAFFLSSPTLLIALFKRTIKHLVKSPEINRIGYCLVVIIGLSLAACSTPSSQLPKLTEQASPQTDAENIQAILQQIQANSGSQRDHLQLKLAALLLEEKQREHAYEALQNVSPKTLSNADFVTYSSLLCRIQIKRGEYTQALNTLDNPRLTATSTQISIKKQILLSSLRAKTLAFLGSHLASAQQRIYIDPLLDNNAQLENRKSIWRSLMYLSKDDLAQYQQTAFGEEYQGWMALALIAKNVQRDLNEQVKQLDQWQLKWNKHPANQQLPEDLALIRELANNQAKHIAILLPLTGNKAIFGQAIRDGFMAAHYETAKRGSTTPTIKIYDTETKLPFMSVYHQAITDGAEVIIGPLDKEHVRLLFDEDSSIPTLALNRIDDYGTPPPQVFQFGLAPADEAKQIAELAFLEKHRQALIIRPAGSWGEKVSSDFEKHWQALGGKTLYNSVFTDQSDYSSSIKNALLLQHSETRAKKIQSIIGEHIEFTPRRRDDIDMIFLLAKPEQARSIKPLLNFHYANDLPIYATSRVYSGYEDKKRDRDINGITFTDIPWVLKPNTPLKTMINQEISSSKLYQHMYALGVDSYQLYPRLKQLQKIPESHVYGETGTLSLNKQNQIERTVLLAKIINGKAKIIAAADESLNTNNDLLE